MEVTPPAAPALLSLQRTAAGITVTWQPPENDGGAPITGYRVNVLRRGAVVDTRSTGAEATSLLVDGLDPAVTYRFSVKAVNDAGAGPDSGHSEPVKVADGPVNNAATGAPAVRLAARGTVLAVSGGTVADADGVGDLTWVWQQRAAGGWEDVATGQRLTVTDRLRGSKVRALVRFTDDEGFTEERASAAVRIRVVAPGKPGVRVRPGPRGGARTVTVRMSAPATTGGSDLRGYRVVVTRAGNGKVKAVRRVTTGTAAVSIRLPKGTYRVRVTAWNGVGHGAATVSGKVAAR
ncbi:fibronectin type III domain-containing protein [Nocardioides sp. TF02-7]|uniref:fibronectin type III domain-containing protein n=1 Tax=Nocardioides sp. TF02-7 TaxID=2917724 RepID=UPI001F063B97|nr:fibronectin type III domain-containing protein [Nocardioides sp. TF02-7]UMG92630.1 fibronectin type III domain-containing protein [Nocardioides sp. TF02-7]